MYGEPITSFAWRTRGGVVISKDPQIRSFHIVFFYVFYEKIKVCPETAEQ